VIAVCLQEERGEKELTNNAMKDRRQRVAFWVLGE